MLGYLPRLRFHSAPAAAGLAALLPLGLLGGRRHILRLLLSEESTRTSTPLRGPTDFPCLGPTRVIPG